MRQRPCCAGQARQKGKGQGSRDQHGSEERHYRPAQRQRQCAWFAVGSAQPDETGSDAGQEGQHMARRVAVSQRACHDQGQQDDAHDMTGQSAQQMRDHGIDQQFARCRRDQDRQRLSIIARDARDDRSRTPWDQAARRHADMADPAAHAFAQRPAPVGEAQLEPGQQEQRLHPPWQQVWRNQRGGQHQPQQQAMRRAQRPQLAAHAGNPCRAIMAMARSCCAAALRLRVR